MDTKVVYAFMFFMSVAGSSQAMEQEKQIVFVTKEVIVVGGGGVTRRVLARHMMKFQSPKKTEEIERTKFLRTLSRNLRRQKLEGLQSPKGIRHPEMFIKDHNDQQK